MKTQLWDGATWPIAVLTSAFCPDFDPQRLAMAMCVGYFEGRSSGEPARFSVLGFVSSKARWRDFETRWSRILRREGLSALNPDDVLNHTAAEAAEAARYRSLLDTLGRLAEQHIYHAFARSIHLPDYDALDAEYGLRDGGAGPYAICAAFVMTDVRQWMATRHPDDLTLFVLEQGDIEQRELRRVLQAVGVDAGEPAQIWPRCWRDERGRPRYLRPLEACTLFAADRDGALVKRLADRSLLETRHIDRARLEQLCHALGISRRSARSA
jgi:hypothetical protein